MKNIPILAPSRLHLQAFLAACPWINHEHVVAVESERGYYPVKHVHTFDLAALPTDNEFLAILEPKDDEDEDE